MKGLICQNCNSEKQVLKYELDKFYVCADCGHVIGYDCPDCNHFYEYNHLALNNNIYVCKECGRKQWGYTAYKKRESC